MKLIQYLGLLIAVLLVGTGVSYAASITYGTGGSITMGTAATAIYSAPQGTITGYTTNPSKSTTCGANAAYYDKLVRAGATWQRTDMQWEDIQSTSSVSFLWGGFDCMVNDATALGITTVLIIDYAPQWAAHSSCTVSGSQLCAPVDAATYATFCAAAQTHFPNQKYWEIWNEPNLAFFWGPTPNATEYTSALNACYSAIKAVNPNAVIVAGALSRGGDIFPPTFVNTMYSNAATFDVISLHPYTYPYTTTSGNGSNSWPDVATIRSTMVSHGDSAKPIWITEFGAPTCGPGTRQDVNPASFSFGSDYVSLDAQRAIADSVIASVKTQTYIEHFFWYTLVDGNSNSFGNPENCFGTYFSSGNAKQAWNSIRSN